MPRNFRARDLVADAYDAHPHDIEARKDFIRARGKEYGMSIVVILAILSFAIKLWELWRSRDLSQAPVEPIDGEPEFDEDSQ
ncbi:MAG: hypothetical protein AAGJ40_09480 [Planctomycetota bacterium]